MGISNEEIDAFHKAKGHSAPRITPEHVANQIKDTTYYRHGVLTICVLTLANGFYVIGESAPASPENFDENLGRQIARRNAADKIWTLEGYRLKTDLMHNRVPFSDRPELDAAVQRDATEQEASS